MPDEMGRLTPQEMQAAHKRFMDLEKEVGHDLKCEVCGTGMWMLNPVLSSLVTDSPMGLLGARSKIPLITFSCVKCGNTKAFAGKNWGIMFPDVEEPDNEARPETHPETASAGGAGNGN